MGKTILLFLALFSGMSLPAQTDTAWIYTYGGKFDDVCNQIRPALHNGFIACGTTSSYGQGNTNMYVIRLDSLCRRQWSAVFGGRDNQAGCAVTTTADRGFAFAGYTDSYGNGGYDVYLVRADSSGRMLWQRTYGGADWDFGYSVKQTKDGGFVICGLTYSYGAGSGDVYLIRTRGNGDTVWTRTFGGTGCDIGNSITITGDTLYTITGSTTSFGNHDTSAYLIQVDTNGVLRNSHTYGCIRNSSGYSIVPTLDQGFIQMGSMDSVHSGVRGLMLLKTDHQGRQQWIEQLTNGAWQEVGKDVVQAADASFLIAGAAAGGGYGSSSMHIMHYDSGGNYIAGPSFGGNNTQCGNSVAIGGNGTVVFAGATTSYGSGNNDVFLVRFKNDSIAQNPFVVIHSFYDSLSPNSIRDAARQLREVRVFPNPLTDESTVLIADRAGAPYFLNLYDGQGRCLRRKIAFRSHGHDLSEAKLERGELCPGLYIYTIERGDEISYSGKLILE
ncbi:MAG: T9SS type A sorting domain-containing protein [Bacteroidia bacterium]